MKENLFKLNETVKFERDGKEQIGTINYVMKESAEQLLYESMCSCCEDARHCHEECTVCDEFFEALQECDREYYYIYSVNTEDKSYYLSESEIKEVI